MLNELLVDDAKKISEDKGLTTEIGHKFTVYILFSFM